jgi:hypothetical protein
MLEQQLALLGRLAEAGLEIAVALERQAKGETEVDVARGDIALAYARVARAVRLTIALQTKLIADFNAFGMDEVRARSQEARCAESDRQDLDKTRKVAVKRVMARVICAEAEDQETADRLFKEVGERLNDPTLCGDLNRPFSEIVAGICRDLGLSPDWAVLSQEAWAREEVQSGRPGAPLQTPLPLDGGEVGSGGERAEPDRMAQEAAPPMPIQEWRREHPHPYPSPIEGEGKIQRRSTA